jgi:hypothetical protein
MTTAIEEQGVPHPLASRIAGQLIRKFAPKDLGDDTVWRAIGQHLNREITQLRAELRLTDRIFFLGLPKLSAAQLKTLFEETEATVGKFGRSIAHAALTAADPLAMARRYAHAFQDTLQQLYAEDPKIARTLAAAAFKSLHPLDKSLEYLRRFQQLVRAFKGNYAFIRTIAKAAFSAPDPLLAAQAFIRDYQAILAEMRKKGAQPAIARTLASVAALGADPLPTARRLLDNFKLALDFARTTHPAIARTVALAACRATEPLELAATYLDNYDRIVEFISKTDPQRAHDVAHHAAYHTKDPFTWAQRYLKQIKAKRRLAPAA